MVIFPAGGVHVNDFRRDRAASPPAANKTRMVRAGEDGNGGFGLGGRDVLAGGIVTNEFIRLAYKSGHLADGAVDSEQAVSE